MYVEAQLAGYDGRGYPVYYSQQLGDFLVYDEQLGFFNPFKAIGAIGKGIFGAGKFVATKVVPTIVKAVPKAAAGFATGGPVGAIVGAGVGIAGQFIGPGGQAVSVPGQPQCPPLYEFRRNLVTGAPECHPARPAVGTTSTGYSPGPYFPPPPGYPGYQPPPPPAPAFDMSKMILPVAAGALLLVATS